jgi:hypothetical protein
VSSAPLAHAGHWLVNVLYLVPLVIVVAMLGVAMVRDRRAEAAENAAESPVGDAAADEPAPGEPAAAP